MARDHSPACGCDTAATTLASVDAALALALGCVAPVSVTEDVALDRALGRILARDVVAGADQPPFDNAGMDGYALRAADFGTGPLPVVGTAAAGDPPATLAPGTALRIFTGAPIPVGADTVLAQEDAQVTPAGLTALHAPRSGNHLRRKGEDRRAGEVALAAGTRLGPRQIAACAAAGSGVLRVTRVPRLGLLTTGDELTRPGDPLVPGAIWDVNEPMLTAALTAAGCDAVTVRHAPDTPEALLAALSELARDCDMVITSGGVSVGDRDHARPVLEAFGARVLFAGVAMKPGKPVTVSTLGAVPVLSLPGNPVSAYVTWHLFGRPMLDKLSGNAFPAPAQRRVRLATGTEHKLGRCEFRPATLSGIGADGVPTVTCPDRTRSACIDQLSATDGLIRLPASRTTFTAGDLVDFYPFD